MEEHISTEGERTMQDNKGKQGGAGIAQKVIANVGEQAEKVRTEIRKRAEEAGTKAQLQAIQAVRSLLRLEHRGLSNAIKGVGSVQARAEKMVRSTVNKATWLPAEGKDVVAEWVKMLHSGRVEFQKTIDKSFALLLKYLDRLEKEIKTGQAPAAPKAAPTKKTAVKKTTSSAAKKKAAKA